MVKKGDLKYNIQINNKLNVVFFHIQVTFLGRQMLHNLWGQGAVDPEAKKNR